MRTVSLAALAVSFAFSTLACAVTPEVAGDDPSDGDVEDSEAAVSIESTSTFFTARQDMRKCMYPMCGGWWVKRVNKTTTKCANGRWESECYVSEIDWSSAGLTSEDAYAGDAVLRGTIGSLVHPVGTFGVFKATEAWTAATAGTPSGSFYRVTDTKIRCVRAPCFSLAADKLNTTTGRVLSSLSGAQAEAASKYVADSSIIATGTVKVTSGGGRALAVSQVWTRVQPKVDPSLACVTDADCTRTAAPTAVSSTDECYCTFCPTTVMNVTTADANAETMQKFCSDFRLTCPQVKCMAPPPVACVSGACVGVVN